MQGRQSGSRVVERAASLYRQARTAKAKEQAALKQLRQQLKAAQEAQAHVQKIAAAVQAKVHKQVAAVVGKCLSAVFGGDYAFEIEFTAKRGKTEAKVWLLKDGRRSDPRDDSGGVRDVVSLGLRLAKLLMERPAKRRMLILDEPFKGVSKKYRPRVAELIDRLSKDLKVQFLITTHDPEFMVGKVVKL